MRKFYLVLFLSLLVFTPFLTRAGGGPDAFGYVWLASNDVGGPTYSWVDISTSGTLVTGLADDNSSGPVNLGFPFRYYWSDFNQLKVGSNGWLGFDNTGNIASCFPPIPQAAGQADNYIAPFMSDLNFAGTSNPGSVRYWTNNVDSFVISYLNVPFWDINSGFAGSNTFQVILSGVDSSITFQYNAMNSTFTNSGCTQDIEVGIENSTGAIGLGVYRETIPPNSFAVKFYYPDSVLIAVKDLTPDWNQNTANAGAFVPTGAFSLSSNIKNAGNADVVTSTTVNGALINFIGSPVWTGSHPIPSLLAGEDSLLTFSPQPNITAAGEYLYQVTTSNSNDINPGNDLNATEIQIVDLNTSTTTLSYVSSTATASTGTISWSGGGGGNDGIGIYIEPPIYPVTINSLSYFISASTADGFVGEIYDDNGTGGGPGTVLSTTTVPFNSVTTNSWNTITLSTPVTITSGGFYVSWLMSGASISLGTINSGPESNRNYEVLSGSWAEFRNNPTEDCMIRVGISGYPCGPSSGFSATTSGNAVSFANSSTGGSSVSWDFGDGNTSTALTPTHTYATSGTYTVCQVVSNACGADTTCASVTVCVTPASSYTYSVSGLTSAFTDQSTGQPTSFTWDFGDGNTSTQQSPTHTYAASGTYTVCLVTSTSCASDTTCQTVFVCQVPTSGFSFNASVLTVSFTSSSANATSYAWDFGDGNSSTQQNPSHTYLSDGTFQVCLVATNSCSADTFCTSVTVCVLPTPNFSFQDNGGTVTFSDQTSPAPSGWFWDFGDGTTSTQQNPSHTYSVTGIYSVCLTAIDACGDSATSCQNATVVVIGLSGDIQGLKLEAWPNPVTDLLNLRFDLSGELKGTLSLNDLTGRQLLRKKLDLRPGVSQLELELSGIAAGVYVLEIESDRGRQQLRVVRN